MSEQLDTATPDTTTEAHGVLLTDVAADKVRSSSSRRAAMTFACASACSPVAAPA